jgi:cytochrome c-type biogenesis protein CcmH/NrfG
LVTARASWPRLLAIALLLGALVASVRGGQGGSGDANPIVAECELNPPSGIVGLERCLALNPRDVETMLDLGALYEAAHLHGRAETLYRQALAVDPKDGDVHVRLGRVRLEGGDRAGAASRARDALAIQPRSPRALELLHRVGQDATK